ncbi:MAG: hypothetical protein KJO88_05495 [Gammaproteobacteria bacterium]|nr:hypothetical protein [Gammaproteobacteria bacterium]
MSISQIGNNLRNFNNSFNQLIPKQQTSVAKKILRSADCYQQKFIKYPRIGIFHSYAELLHSALLEGNPRVSTLVPQPFKLRHERRVYIPDCFYIEGEQRYVIELKPQGKFKKELRIALEEYFKVEGMEFKVIANEAIMEQEILALNWLHIIRTLLGAAQDECKTEELKLLDRLSAQGEMEIGDVIYMGDRIGQRKSEIAMYRLAHRGKIVLGLSDNMISSKSSIKLCI